jgi:hypothetical protein
MRFEANDSEDKCVVTALYLAEVEKAKFRARKDVLVTALSGIDDNLVPRPTPSPGDNEELAVRLKPLIRMAVTAEE